MTSTQTVATAVLFAIAVTFVDAAPNAVPLGRLKHSAEKMVLTAHVIFSCPHIDDGELFLLRENPYSISKKQANIANK